MKGSPGGDDSAGHVAGGHACCFGVNVGQDTACGEALRTVGSHGIAVVKLSKFCCIEGNAAFDRAYQEAMSKGR